MDLEELAQRLDHERGTERSGEEVMILTPEGEVLTLLSLNWDGAAGCWLLVGDPQ